MYLSINDSLTEGIKKGTINPEPYWYRSIRGRRNMSWVKDAKEKVLTETERLENNRIYEISLKNATSSNAPIAFQQLIDRLTENINEINLEFSQIPLETERLTDTSFHVSRKFRPEYFLRLDLRENSIFYHVKSSGTLDGSYKVYLEGLTLTPKLHRAHDVKALVSFEEAAEELLKLSIREAI